MTQQTQYPIPFFTSFLFLCSFFCGMFLHAPAAHAVEGALVTGKTLILLCNSAKQDDRFVCQSYIAGVVDYHRLIKSLGTAPSVDFCLPKDIKMEQIKTIVTQYLMTRTEHQDFIAAPAVAMSLFSAYPCKRGKK